MIVFVVFREWRNGSLLMTTIAAFPTNIQQVLSSVQASISSPSACRLLLVLLPWSISAGLRSARCTLRVQIHMWGYIRIVQRLYRDIIGTLLEFKLANGMNNEMEASWRLHSQGLYRDIVEMYWRASPIESQMDKNMENDMET